MLPGSNEGFLGRVIGQVRVPAHPVHHVDHSLSVTADQLAEGLPVPLFGERDKLLLGFPWRHRPAHLADRPFYPSNVTSHAFIRSEKEWDLLPI
jgi:hypothetical protein